MPDQKAGKYPVFTEGDREHMEFFESAFNTMCFSADDGAQEVECGACGRTHFVIPSWMDMSDEVKYELVTKKSNDPEGYVEHDDCVGITTGECFGQMFVFGCPCGYDLMVRDQIWIERDKLSDYISSRAKEEVRVLNAILESLGSKTA